MSPLESNMYIITRWLKLTEQFNTKHLAVGSRVRRKKYAISKASDYFTAKIAPNYVGHFVVRRRIFPNVYELESAYGEVKQIWYIKDLKAHPPEDNNLVVVSIDVWLRICFLIVLRCRRLFWAVGWASGLENAVSIDAVRLRSETRRDMLLGLVFNFIGNDFPVQTDDLLLKLFSTRKQEHHINNGIILWCFRIVVPVKLRDQLLAEFHSTHEGISKVNANAKTAYFWLPYLVAVLKE
ncbi:hypothetical protein ILUMI_04372 [Ignelater luminosus]|uniref:Uncharacterized protein n=1 Tax=Ignelater luminosus TaxID=2038154 RepID=A0A8K0GEM2_IGNLU|nr:hypothetical protein ILUMI_04372 [Ignelater luminosus]